MREVDLILAFPCLAGADAERSAHSAAEGLENGGHALRAAHASADHGLERENDQRVARQHRQRLTMGDMDGGAAAPCVGVVKTG